MPEARSELRMSVTTASKVVALMLTVPGNAACSWLHDTVTAGSRKPP